MLFNSILHLVKIPDVFHYADVSEVSHHFKVMLKILYKYIINGFYPIVILFLLNKLMKTHFTGLIAL
jgi:hypothetical protein